MEKSIKLWLKKWGKTFYDPHDGYYPDCDMIDSCMHDLSLSEENRPIVTKLVTAWLNDN